MKLNTDGSSLGNSSLTGGAGVIRDKVGNWVVGFAHKIGKTTSFLAKLWALHDRLNLCYNHSFVAVEVDIYAKSLVDAISNLNYTNLFVYPLMDDSRLLASQIPRICFRHFFCEANRCADALAHMGEFQSTNFVIFESPPVDLVNFLDFNFNGLYLNKL